MTFQCPTCRVVYPTRKDHDRSALNSWTCPCGIGFHTEIDLDNHQKNDDHS